MSSEEASPPDVMPEADVDPALDRAFWEFMAAREELRRHFIPDEGRAGSSRPRQSQ